MGSAAPVVAEVVVDVRPIPEPLDYLVPCGVHAEIGSLVRVPLHGRRVRGWVVGLRPLEMLSERVRSLLRPIHAAVTPVPVGNAATVGLWRWGAAEYAGPVAAIAAWATPAPLPRGRPPAMSPPAPSRVPELPRITAAVRAQKHVKAFVRTWPSDDGAGTIRPLVDAMPPGRTALVVSPAGRLPHLPGATVLGTTASWEIAAAGAARAVVGGRHTPLVPVPCLGLVVVTHEHSEVHKDERTPALDARVLARRRAEIEGVPFVAMGPTSPVGWEGLLAYAAAVNEPVVRLTVPGTARRWPHVEIADLRSEPPGGGALGNRFFTAVRGVLQAGGRVLVFLNRTGTARALVCRACGAVAACERCGGTLRPGDGVMACVRCDLRLPFVACPACGSPRVRALGVGVTRLRGELARAFPSIEVVEASGDAAPLPPGPCIVAGTRVALRHEEAFDLVVLADPDAFLGRPGIRGEEAAFALIVDAVAAARGRHKGGRVLVQTRRPDHPAVSSLLAADTSRWEDAMLENRRATRWPPFRRLLSVEAATPGPVADAAGALEALGAEVLGPRAVPRPGLLALVEPAVWAMAASAAREAVLAHPGVRVRVEADPLDPH